jgi:hypothetical protein
MPESSTRCGSLGAALLTLVLSGAPALAQTPQKVAPIRLTPAQQQKLFPERRRLSLEATQARIAILEKHQRCLSAASTPQALQSCQKEERKALMTQRQQQRNAMKQLFERNGIPMPRGMAAPGTAL